MRTDHDRRIVTDLREELANVRAEYDGHIATLKTQQTCTKAKAITILLRQKKASEQRIASIEDDLQTYSEELGQLIDRVRHVDSENTDMHEESVVLKDRVRELTAEATESEDWKRENTKLKR